VIRAVVFDIGETLLDDTREWEAWADWLSVPTHTLSALVGAVVAQGRDNADALRLIRPGLDVAAERRARQQAGHGEQILESDLYPDVRSAFTQLRRAGIWVGVAGNQTERTGALLRALELPIDAIATSAEWGVAKPDPDFFRRVISWAPGRPEEIAYVGDHPRNDIDPARAAGLRTAHIRRGPWGYLWADDPAVHATADWRVNRLTDLPPLLASS
jgi:HAD superfamily hydrolase (TIGR01549 family)